MNKGSNEFFWFPTVFQKIVILKGNDNVFWDNGGLFVLFCLRETVSTMSSSIWATGLDYVGKVYITSYA